MIIFFYKKQNSMSYSPLFYTSYLTNLTLKSPAYRIHLFHSVPTTSPLRLPYVLSDGLSRKKQRTTPTEPSSSKCSLTSHLSVAAANGFHAYVACRTAKKTVATVTVNVLILFHLSRNILLNLICPFRFSQELKTSKARLRVTSLNLPSRFHFCSFHTMG